MILLCCSHHLEMCMFRMDIHVVSSTVYTPARGEIGIHLLDLELFFAPSDSEPVYPEQAAYWNINQHIHIAVCG